MASESTQPVELTAIPNSVSGDGTVFVKGLKKYLRGYSKNVSELMENSTAGVISQVSNLSLVEQHIKDGDISKTNLCVFYTTEYVQDFASAQIWVATESDLVWKKHGATDSTAYIISDVTVSETYYVKVVCVNSDGATSSFESAPMESIFIRGNVLVCNSPTQFYWDNSSNRWTWNGYVDNGYTDFFEIRLDKNPGVYNEYRLDAVQYNLNINYSDAAPAVRSGTAFLYVRNIYGTYNSPLAHVFSVSALPKPIPALLEKTKKGATVTLQALPDGCTNYVVEVGGEEYEVFSNVWTYYQFEGVLDLRYCFVDSVGRSEWSDISELVIGKIVTESSIASSAITSTKIATNAITADKVEAGAITAVKIASSAVTTDKLDAGAVTTTKLDAQAVTADKLAANSVTAAKISSGAIVVGGSAGNVTITPGAITADKISASSLSSISATIGFLRTATSGARMELESNQLRVYDSNNVLRVRLGVW